MDYLKKKKHKKLNKTHVSIANLIRKITKYITPMWIW